MKKKNFSKTKKVYSRRGKAYNISKAFFQAFPGLIALLDERGTIVDVNKAWIDKGLRFGLFFRPDTIGYNYVELCEKAKEEGDETSRKVLQGLQDVLGKKRESFSMLYSFEAGLSPQFYFLTIFSLPTKPRLIAVVHQEIPEDLSSLLETKSSNLVEKNSTAGTSSLEVLMDVAQIYSLVENKIIPFFHLIVPYLPLELKKIFEDLEREVKEKFIEEGRKYHPFSGLSLREAQVAILVKEGRTSEEIAKMLGLSKSAVDFYRKRLRKRFGLKGKKESLAEYLKKIEGSTKL